MSYPRALYWSLGDLLFLTGALVILPSVAFGQVSLTGRVTDENNVPVAGARVFLRPASSPDSPISWLQTLSDPTGAFTFILQISGDY
ncbi:MAG: hypothetical protein DMG06_02615 [Acidobacteria bacterium]|nr:MAG: hypothetical protein DMG06_02615 [Acidobacteriota bacterium]